jgi:hypothetical protein
VLPQRRHRLAFLGPHPAATRLHSWLLLFFPFQHCRICLGLAAISALLTSSSSNHLDTYPPRCMASRVVYADEAYPLLYLSQWHALRTWDMHSMLPKIHSHASIPRALLHVDDLVGLCSWASSEASIRILTYDFAPEDLDRVCEFSVTATLPSINPMCILVSLTC